MVERVKKVGIIAEDNKILWFRMGQTLYDAKCLITNYPTGIDIIGKIRNSHVFKQVAFWRVVVDAMCKDRQQRMDFVKCDKGKCFLLLLESYN
jgi:hypothetical protein